MGYLESANDPEDWWYWWPKMAVAPLNVEPLGDDWEEVGYVSEGGA